MSDMCVMSDTIINTLITSVFQIKTGVYVFVSDVHLCRCFIDFGQRLWPHHIFDVFATPTTIHDHDYGREKFLMTLQLQHDCYFHKVHLIAIFHNTKDCDATAIGNLSKI